MCLAGQYVPLPQQDSSRSFGAYWASLPSRRMVVGTKVRNAEEAGHTPYRCQFCLSLCIFHPLDLHHVILSDNEAAKDTWIYVAMKWIVRIILMAVP